MLAYAARAFAILAVIGVAVTASTAATAPAAAAEFRVNTYTDGYQTFPAIARLTNGTFVVVWQSSGQDGSFYGVYGRRYYANGKPASAEFRVNTLTIYRQEAPAIAALAGGGFVVVWQSTAPGGLDFDIRGQRFNANGKKIDGEFGINIPKPGDESFARVAALNNGGFVVVWQSDSQDGSYLNIYGQRFSADGVKLGAEFLVNTTIADAQDFPTVAVLPGGGFVVVWESHGQDGDGYGIYGQRFSAAGDKVGSEFRVNRTTKDHQDLPKIAPLAGGGFVVVWTGDTTSGDVFAQRYAADGRRAGGQFRVNTTVADAQAITDVARLNTGGFIVVWSSRNQDGDQFGVYGQRYSAAGDKVGVEFRINETKAHDQTYPAVAALLNQAFAVVWDSFLQDGSFAGIYGKRFNQ